MYALSQLFVPKLTRSSKRIPQRLRTEFPIKVDDCKTNRSQQDETKGKLKYPGDNRQDNLQRNQRKQEYQRYNDEISK